MDLCEQCRTHSATHIDDEAVFWCGRCADARQADSRDGYPYLWLITERRHFLSAVYPTLRYSSFIQDKRNPLWAKKLGIPFVPPGQRAVDQDDPPDDPSPQQEIPVEAMWAIHVSEDGRTETWTLKSTPAQLAMQKQPPPAELESWHKAQRYLAMHQRTKETLLKAQMAIKAQKRADAALKGREHS